MPVAILGINHKTAPVSVREKVAFAPHNIQQALKSFTEDTLIQEVAILSTCNRMEVVYRLPHGTEDNDSQKRVLSWLAKYHQVGPNQIEPHCYYHNNGKAVSHLMAVACGLDSMVLGEPQILGQVKDAYGYANNAGTMGRYLNRLFEQTFTLAKQVRTDTQIGESAVSVAYAAVTLAKRIFADFEKVTALFIGAGETIELAARHLVRHGVKNIHVANRTVERAESLAVEIGGQAHSLASLSELVQQADIVISSTASPIPVIGKGLVENAIVARRHRSMFMVDLAVPRDIEPEVASLNDIYLYTVDDMQGVIQENLKLREEAAKEAFEIVERHSAKYLAWLKSLTSVSLLKDFRNQIENIKDEEIGRAIAKLSIQDEQTEKLFTELANRLTKKFMHLPSRSIRKAGEENDLERLQWLAEIFELKKDK